MSSDRDQQRRINHQARRDRQIILVDGVETHITDIDDGPYYMVWIPEGDLNPQALFTREYDADNHARKVAWMGRERRQLAVVLTITSWRQYNGHELIEERIYEPSYDRVAIQTTKRTRNRRRQRQRAEQAGKPSNKPMTETTAACGTRQNQAESDGRDKPQFTQPNRSAPCNSAMHEALSGLLSVSQERP